MPHAAAEVALTPGDALRSQEKSVKILARSLFRELRTNGYDNKQIVALSTELISLLTTDMSSVSQAAPNDLR